MKKHHVIHGLRFHESKMTLSIDGEERSFELSEISDVLTKASEKERNTYEFSPSGYGIHWPLLDEDLSIDGLLGIVHTPDTDSREQPDRPGKAWSRQRPR